MDFLDRTIDYIESNVTLYTRFTVGLLGDGNSIAIRPTPSTSPERYLEGSKNKPFQFQILGQHENNLTAYKALQDIEQHIDGLTNRAIISSDGSFVFNHCEVYTSTNFVEKTSHGYIWTAIFQAELYIKKGA